MAGKIKIALPGAAGRMGRAIAAAVDADDRFEIVATTARGDDAQVLIAPKPDVIIDFTLADASVAHAELAADAGIPVVIGATGHNEEQKKRLEEAAKKTAIALCANSSFGIPVLARMIERLSEVIFRDWKPSDWDVEIHETHHRNKIDAPSGTALMLGEAVARGRNVSFDDNIADYARHGKTGKREDGKIGFSVSRGGNVVGEHRVVFYGLHGEEMEFRHRATDRSVYAKGALAISRALLLKESPGLYPIQKLVDLGI